MNASTGYTVLLTEQMPNGITRQIAVGPAYGPDPAGGNGSMSFEISVRRRSAGISWEFFAGWYTQQTREEWKNRGLEVMDADGNGQLVRHSSIRVSEAQDFNDKCTVLGLPCFSTVGYSASQKMFDEFVLAPERLWATLEAMLVVLEGQIEQELANARNFS